MTGPGEVLGWCLRFFAHHDESNAAVHCAEVRYSPITFSLADELMNHRVRTGEHETAVDDVIARVLADKGQYEEDKGR